MSAFIYPTLPGLTFDTTRTPIFKTNVQESPSGKESRFSYQFYPRVKYNLIYSLLRDDVTPSEFRQLAGLYEAMQGQFDTFLFVDPDFNAVTTENFGTGDGSTIAFQLSAKFQVTGGPGWPNIVQNLNGTPSIFKSAVLQTGGGVNYSLGPTGIITFTAAPAAAAPLTWTGSFYIRCRFTQDSVEFVKNANKWWQGDSVEFISVKL
jgi:uncharacterized protein (TIGR02217 family)